MKKDHSISIESKLVIINNKDQLNPEIWQRLKAYSEVKLTLDLFQFGFIYFKNEQQKVEHLQLIDQSWKPWATGFFG